MGDNEMMYNGTTFTTERTPASSEEARTGTARIGRPALNLLSNREPSSCTKFKFHLLKNLSFKYQDLDIL